MKYLDTLLQLNIKVGMSGVMWRELIKEGLTDFILDLLPLTQGGEPQEDDAMILCIKEHGLHYERRQGEKKLATTASMSTSTSAGKKCKRSGEGTGATPVSENSSAPLAKKQLTASHAGNTGGGRKARTPRFTKDKMAIALKGVQLTLREARDKCYTSVISTHEGTGMATAEALLRLLPHNGTHLYGITIEYVDSCTRYHPCINVTHNSMN